MWWLAAHCIHRVVVPLRRRGGQARPAAPGQLPPSARGGRAAQPRPRPPVELHPNAGVRSRRGALVAPARDACRATQLQPIPGGSCHLIGLMGVEHKVLVDVRLLEPRRVGRDEVRLEGPRAPGVALAGMEGSVGGSYAPVQLAPLPEPVNCKSSSGDGGGGGGVPQIAAAEEEADDQACCIKKHTRCHTREVQLAKAGAKRAWTHPRVHRPGGRQWHFPSLAACERMMATAPRAGWPPRTGARAGASPAIAPAVVMQWQRSEMASVYEFRGSPSVVRPVSSVLGAAGSKLAPLVKAHSQA
jgi:hypothetical protein